MNVELEGDMISYLYQIVITVMIEHIELNMYVSDVLNMYVVFNICLVNVCFICLYNKIFS